MKIALMGATGLVGSVALRVMEERGFGDMDLSLVASERSIGKKLEFAGREIEVIGVEEALNKELDYAVFSAGGRFSREYARRFTQNGVRVIDNSSAWRMDKDVPLVVPEINFDSIKPSDMIIANPNCSTIQLALILYPLFRRYGMRRVVVSTYQSVSGSGEKAIRQLESEERSQSSERVYPHPIHRNVLPHGGSFESNGYTSEEEKLVYETQKILGSDSIGITSTVVRVPVIGGHSESVNIELEKEFYLDEIKTILKNTPGVVLMDNPSENTYPMPLVSEGRDEVFVGRIRRDFSQANSLNLWIVADNLRKGAATNAIQILEALIGNNKVF